MTKAAAPGARLPLATALALAALNLPIMALGIAMNVHMPAYFAASMGMSLAAVAAAFGIVRLIDVPLEIFLGLGMARTKGRLGRYRPWIVGGVPILMFGLFMLLSADQGVGTAYLVAWLLVMYLGNSILALAMQAWAATLAASYDERARLFGLIAAVGVVGAIAIAAVPAVMARFGYDDVEGVRAIFWCVIALAPAAVAAAVLGAPERMAAETTEHKFSLREHLELVANPNMWRILVMDLLTALGPFWMGATYLFFTRDYLGFRVADTSLLLGAYLAAGLAGAPAIAWLATKISKHRAVMVAGIGYVLSICVMPFLKELPAFAMASVLGGFMAAGLNVMTRAMTADVADELRLQQGKDQSALLYALVTLTSKLGGGLAIFMAYGALSLVGYDPKLGAGNTPEAMRGLALCFAGGPTVLILLGVVALTGYRLTATRAAEIRRLLEIRDREAQAEAEPQGAPAELRPA